MTTARRAFLGNVIGGAALARTGVVLPEETMPTDRLTKAMIEAWEAVQEKQSWDTSWTDRITGKYRQVFDSPEIEEGSVFHQARSFLQGFTDVYGTKDSEMSAVVVIRHAAIPLAMNDRLWDELELGKEFKVKDAETGKAARRNPFLNANVPKTAKYGLIWPDGGLDTLLKRGAIGLCCNLALFRMVSMIVKREKLDGNAAREKALANLVPGMIVQPSGIFAVARAQAAGCQYLRSA